MGNLHFFSAQRVGSLGTVPGYHVSTLPYVVTYDTHNGSHVPRYP